MATAMSSARSTFSGRNMAFRAAGAVRVVPVTRPVSVTVEAGGKTCDLLRTKRNKANSVSFSNKKSRKWQEPNLQDKKVYWAAGQRWVSLRLSTRAIKTLEKNGLDAMAAKANIDLWKLPFVDARPQRLQYLAENKGKVPVAKNPCAMKNPTKLAASKKLPKYPVYEEGGRIVWIRPGEEENVFGKPEETGAAAAAQPAAPAQLKITLTE